MDPWCLEYKKSVISSLGILGVFSENKSNNNCTCSMKNFASNDKRSILFISAWAICNQTANSNIKKKAVVIVEPQNMSV